MITERDNYNIIDTAKDDGKAEGFIAGKIEGRAEAEKDIARRMMEAGMDRETILKITGISKF